MLKERQAGIVEVTDAIVWLIPSRSNPPGWGHTVVVEGDFIYCSCAGFQAWSHCWASDIVKRHLGIDHEDMTEGASQ